MKMSELEKLLEQLNLLNKKISNMNHSSKTIIFTAVLLELISSKKIFKRNKDAAEFLSKTLNFELPEYGKKSRTIMLGKISRFYLNETDKYDINSNLDFIYEFISKLLKNEDEVVSWSSIIESMEI